MTKPLSEASAARFLIFGFRYSASRNGETRLSWFWGWIHRGLVHNWEEVKHRSEDAKRAIEVLDWHLANDLI